MPRKELNEMLMKCIAFKIKEIKFIDYKPLQVRSN